MNIAVVILNWNGKELLKQFLPSVIAHSKYASIYLADNASTDDSIDFVTQNYPSIKIIRNTENGGYARGYNEALQHLDEDIFCLLNSDVEVTANWLDPIVSRFQVDKNVAIIQPKILDFKKKTHFEYAGAAGGYIDKYGYPFCRGRIFHTIEKDEQQYDQACELFWASGACFFIRKQVFTELNGFDEDFFAHQEEIDLCWRAFNKSYKSYFEPSSVIYHVGGATLSTNNPKKTYLNFRNSLFMLLKNLPKRKVFPIIFVRMLLDGVAGIQFLIKLKPAHFVAIMRAHLSFYSKFRIMKSKRSTSNKNQNYYMLKSIVTNYYVYRRKVFRLLITQ
ncbi:glycosyltransferase family 2 protein [Spongiivirga citrea]|uniref:Glycosyltransferase n=1 Tax=Spongiivirga citrea TaxID=1481457 RepID=A0A6M0CFN0_9FLAO|nr:glycosyltransferase family 2 protein [Spongiivirga citrea]NER16686.1 glycosyltransferase [Spongiivirga citrea]